MEPKVNQTCLACGSAPLLDILNFGPQPAANLLCAEANESVRREPLVLRFCDDCGHAQQAVFFPAEELFGHYLYQSGTSGTLRQYFDWLAAGIAAAAQPQASVLEIACNDGSFLEALAQKGIQADGIEPATNLARICRERGLSVSCGFWPDTSPSRQYERIVAMNVLAHTPDPLGFLTQIRESLSDDGLALIQVSQVDMFNNSEFDTLYHEHYSFFSPASLWRLAQRAGFTVGRLLKTDIHGGSMLAVLGRTEASVESAFKGLQTPPYYLSTLQVSERPTRAQAEAFGKYAQATCTTVRGIADLTRAAGRKVVLVGAAAKAITVLQASGLAPDMVVDEAPLKIGKYLPGTALLIAPLESVANIREPCVFIIGAWNFATELRRKLKKLRIADDATVVYFPRFFMEPL